LGIIQNKMTLAWHGYIMEATKRDMETGAGGRGGKGRVGKVRNGFNGTAVVLPRKKNNTKSREGGGNGFQQQEAVKLEGAGTKNEKTRQITVFG